MSRLSKLALKMGGKPIALLTLVVICIAVIVGFLWQYQQTSSHQQQQQALIHQQTAQMIHAAVESRIQALSQQMASIAQSSQLSTVLARNDQSLTELQQRALENLIPDAHKICLLPADIDKPDANACIPITFATLGSLRQAKEDGRSPMAILQLGTDTAHLLSTHSIKDATGKVVGILVVTLKPTVVTDLLFAEYGGHGYVELQQGIKRTTSLVSQGDKQWKQGPASFNQPISNSHWKIAYWPAQASSSNSTMLSLLVVLAVIVLMWLLREGWQRYLFKNDTATLRQILADFKEGKLKPKYLLASSGLQHVVDDIQTLGQEVTASSKKGATADSINKKLGEPALVVPDKLTEVKPTEDQAVALDASIFKAYDIRGIVGQTLNEQIMTVIGQAVGSEAKDQGQTRLVVGRDGRLSSDSLTKALMKGIIASGCGVVDIGQVPTPLVYFACEHLDTHSGVMVTGSHNPPEYNGLKIVLAGKTIDGLALQQLYQRIEQGNLHSGTGSKNVAYVGDDYIERVVRDIQVARSIKVVVDCGNGVAGAMAPELLSSLGCEVIELHCEVDGNFPNHHPDPGQPENLQDLITAVQQNDAELGIAFDGDGDRIGVVDANGNPIWPDRLMVMFAQDVLSRKPGATIIYDVKSSNLLGDAISRAGGEALMWQSGHSVIKNKMTEVGAELAGEMSGHIFFKERWYGFDDALYAACRLLELLASDPLERTPTEVFSAIPNRENTPEILIEMDDGESQRFMQRLADEAQFSGAQMITIDGLRADYPDGWGLVRRSNTMPGLTLRFEANSVENLHYIQQQFKQQMLQVKPTLTLLF